MSDPANVYEVIDPAHLDRQVCFVPTPAAHNVVAIYRSLLDPMTSPSRGTCWRCRSAPRAPGQ